MGEKPEGPQGQVSLWPLASHFCPTLAGQGEGEQVQLPFCKVVGDYFFLTESAGNFSHVVK